MADEILKAVFTADTAGFDKGAQNVEKAAAKTEQAMESAAGTAAATSAKMSASMQTAADSAAKAADTINRRFANLFGNGELPTQKAAASVATVTKAVEQTGASLAAGQKQNAAWGDAVAASAAKMRDTIVASFAVVGRSAKAAGDVVAGAGAVVGAAGNAVAQSLANGAQAATAAQRVHERVSAGMVAAYAVAAAGIAAAISKSLAGAQQLSNATQVTGVSVEALERLRFAAERTGGSFDAVVAAVKSYGETVNEIATNPTAKAAQALNAMGVSLRDSSGSVKDFNTLLLDVADKFKGYENGAQKAAIAQAVFKGAGEQLIPLLNRGSDGIKDLGTQAERAGLVMGPEMVKKLADANAEMKNFTAAITRLGAELAVVLSPLGKLVDYVTDVAQKLKKNFNNFLDPIKDTEFAIASLEAKLADLRAGNVPDWDRWVGNTPQMLIEQTEQRLAGLRERLNQLMADASEKNAIHVPTTDVWNTKVVPPDLSDLKLMKDELDDFMSRLHGLPVLMGESFAFDAKPFEEAMQRVIQAEQAGAIAARDATRMKLQLKQMEQSAILDTATLTASTITSVFAQSKGAAAASAVINTAVGVTKALSGSVPPFNFIQAGLVAAAGAAQLASITSASETGAGSVAPVTGSASVASAANEGPQAANNSTLFVQNVNPNAFYSGDMVESLAGKLLQFQADGGRVVFDRG